MLVFFHSTAAGLEEDSCLRSSGTAPQTIRSELLKTLPSADNRPETNFFTNVWITEESPFIVFTIRISFLLFGHLLTVSYCFDRTGC